MDDQYYKDLVLRGWVVFELKHRPSGDFITSKKHDKSNMIIFDGSEQNVLTIYAFAADMSSGKEEWDMKGYYHFCKNSGLHSAIEITSGDKIVRRDVKDFLLMVFDEKKRVRVPTKVRYNEDLLFFENLPIPALRYLLLCKHYTETRGLDFFEIMDQVKLLFDKNSNILERGSEIANFILALDTLNLESKLFGSLAEFYSLERESALKSFIMGIPLGPEHKEKTRHDIDVILESCQTIQHLSTSHQADISMNELRRLHEIYKRKVNISEFDEFVETLNSLPDISIPMGYALNLMKESKMTLGEASRNMIQAMKG